MALLLEGGTYTDTDTAPVIPISEWGHPYTTGTDPLLNHLCAILSPSDTSPDNMEDEPALVLSVESDAIDFGWDDWRSVGLVRAVQIVQWTMAVRPLLSSPTHLPGAEFMRCWVGATGSSGVFGCYRSNTTQDRRTSHLGTTSAGNGKTVQPSKRTRYVSYLQPARLLTDSWDLA